MIAVIPDGTYTIANVQHPGSYMNLYHGHPTAAIIGSSQSEKWIVKNIDNHITLENDGHFAGACNISNSAPLSGSPNAIHWTPEKVSSDVYKLKAGEFYMCLPAGGEYVTIFLASKEHPLAGEMEWRFHKV